MFSILIPAAGLGRRMKSYGPKALIPLLDETVIARQIRLLRAAYPNSKIVVVAGFEADKVRNALPSDVRVVVNPYYETTNVAYSIELGLHYCPPRNPTLIVYGDLVFNKEAIEGLDKLRSCVIVDQPKTQRVEEVGINIVEGKVMCLSFGLPSKWTHIALLHSREAHLFSRIAAEHRRSKQFGFEILNAVIDCGGVFDAHQPVGLSLVEIDTSRDIDRACQIN